MSAVAAPADRRFRRAHVKPARSRHHNWRKLAMPVARYVSVALLVAYAVYRGAGIVVNAHVLQVDRIVVHGNERLSKGDVLTMLSDLRGENVLWTDLDRWRGKLLGSHWVRDASLRRSLPSTIDVTVAERQPVGIGRLNGNMFLVDDRGVVIDQYGPQYADLDLPIIDGLASSSDGATDEARAELAARVISALRGASQIGKRLSQVDVTDLHNAGVILAGDAAVIRLGEDQFLPRLTAYLDLAPTLRERVPDIDYVDLRFDDRVYVRPIGKAPKTGTPAMTARNTAQNAALKAAGRPGRKRK
jgi:cell division protein FtsQ